MPELYLKATQVHLGHIADADLKFLHAQLEEEGLDDTDYTLDPMTLEYFKTNGASAALLELLQKALGEQDEVEIYYTV